MNTFRDELVSHILPFWIEKMQDWDNGGFYGRIDGHNKLHPAALKGAILNARILWTFSAAYRLLRNPQYRTVAERAYNYIHHYFTDPENGGLYWELDCKGYPVNTKKQTYVQGFALYGISEYYRATGEAEALNKAKTLFYLIEEKCRDKNGEGYLEAFTKDWQEMDDMRLSEKDANEKKTMNTHLHLLEPYTNLLRIWNDEQVREAQKKLIRIFTDRILNRETFHLNLFFDANWQVKSETISFGHDIEASWLLSEAMEMLEDKRVTEILTPITLKIADSVMEALLPDGSLPYEKHAGKTDEERHWWVQAEAVVGFMHAYKNTGNEKYRVKAANIWHYIENHLIDRDNGEWYWSIKQDGTINQEEDKAGFWKCPYHNGRMCMEMMSLIPKN